MNFIGLWGSWSEYFYRHYKETLTGKGIKGEMASYAELWGNTHDETGEIVAYSRNGPLAMGLTGDLLSIIAWQGYRLGLPWSEAIRLARESQQLANEEMERLCAAHPLPGVIEFIKKCDQHNVLLVIVTADETSEALKHLAWMGIRRYFKVIIGHDRVAQGKPFPEMVHKACFELALQPDQVALIGDTNSDMQMGNSAGVGGIHWAHE
nr:HAD-IA family hydrolase [Paenibacillus aceris]